MEARVVFACAVLMVISFPAAPVHAQDTLYVDVLGSTPYQTIQSAIDASDDGDWIVVLPGTYSGDGNTDIRFYERNLVVISENDDPTEVVIDCGGQDRAFNLTFGYTDDTSYIAGITIRNGWARAHPDDGGGAILCQGASPNIGNCIFEYCEANGGGAIKLQNSSAWVYGSTFRHNTAEMGGALHAAYGECKITGCTFHDIEATDRGGALRFYGDDAFVQNCTFAQCGADGDAVVAVDGNTYGPDFNSNIIAFSTAGVPVTGGSATDFEVTYCMIYGNAGGDSLGYVPHHDNLFVDPLFCDMAADDYTHCSNTTALPYANPYMRPIGNVVAGCGECESSPVRRTSWGAIKALYR
ncbi:MAG: hypothetical protein GF400_10015 [Candidatus Eisenbacteria bacterium]|nr:hypothetical protein [Candidatus Eisenbacteria bacterium]